MVASVLSTSGMHVRALVLLSVLTQLRPPVNPPEEEAGKARILERVRLDVNWLCRSSLDLNFAHHCSTERGYPH